MHLVEPPFLLSAHYRDSDVLFSAIFEPVTYTKVIFCAGNKDRLNVAFRTCWEEETIPEDHRGSCIPLDDDAHGEHFCLYSHTMDSEIQTTVLLTHEVSHLVDFIFEAIGVPTGKKSTEFRAHLIEFFLGAVMRILFRPDGTSWRVNSPAPDCTESLYTQIIQSLKNDKRPHQEVTG